MAIERRLRIKTLIMVLAMVVCANVGDLMLKRGMSQIGAVQVSLPGLSHAFRLSIQNGAIWIGILFLSGFMLSYMTVLSWADYSYVQPASSFSYAVVAILSYWLLGEVVTPLRWLGILVICFGVLIVGRTHPRTTQESTHA